VFRCGGTAAVADRTPVWSFAIWEVEFARMASGGGHALPPPGQFPVWSAAVVRSGRARVEPSSGMCATAARPVGLDSTYWLVAFVAEDVQP
jgi:hypothetical protein